MCWFYFVLLEGYVPVVLSSLQVAGSMCTDHCSFGAGSDSDSAARLTSAERCVIPHRGDKCPPKRVPSTAIHELAACPHTSQCSCLHLRLLAPKQMYSAFTDKSGRQVCDDFCLLFVLGNSASHGRNTQQLKGERIACGG